MPERGSQHGDFGDHDVIHSHDDRDREMTVNVYFHDTGGTAGDPRIDQILTKLNILTTQGAIIVTDLSGIEAEIAENTDVVNSASALLASLAQEIRDAGTDQAKLNDLAASLDANNANLAAAVAANTPADTGGGTGDGGFPPDGT